MTQKTYLIILKIGIYLSFLSIFLIFKNLLFPYITSKQIYFNILIEILFVFWVAFLVKYPAWRPFGSAGGQLKKTWITIGLLCFFAAMMLSCFTGVDFNLSFWGDVERMLGVFHLLHFLAFYFIIITVMRTRQDWRNLFLASVIVAVLVSLYGIGQRLEIFKSPWGKDRIISTIGNSAYVGAYTIFNICFVLILFFREKDWGKRILYLAALLFIFIALIFSGTRGAYLGFGIGSLVLLFLYVILSRSIKVKKYCLISLIALIVLILLLFSFKNISLVENSPFLSRVTHISLSDATMNTRFISWKTAWLDFENHPILGTGNGNFSITFDKYFDPIFYNYTRSETYFDRAHNNLIDIISTTGLLGIITYLSIFVAAFFYLINGFKKRNISLTEFTLLFCLIIAYFIQNLVVFDALVTYISLMVVLGYIYWLVNKDKNVIEQFKEKTKLVTNYFYKDKRLENKEIFTLVFIGLIMFLIIYQYNIKPIKMLAGTIEGQISLAQGNVIKGVDDYKQALSYDTILDRDSRATLVRSIISASGLLNNIDRQKAQEIFDYTIEQGKKNVKYNEQDSMMQMQLAQILDTAARFNSDNLNKLFYYSDQALEAIDKSIAASPGRVPIYFLKSQIYLTRGEKENAINTLQYAKNLNEDYYDSSCQLARVYFIVEQNDDAFKEMDQCLDMGGVGIFSSVNFIKNLINYYTEKEDVNKIILLYERLSQLEKNDVKVWIGLAKLYDQVGKSEKAIKAAQKAAELDPSLQINVNNFIIEVEQKEVRSEK